jgi:hypothetical protein
MKWWVAQTCCVCPWNFGECYMIPHASYERQWVWIRSSVTDGYSLRWYFLLMAGWTHTVSYRTLTPPCHPQAWKGNSLGYCLTVWLIEKRYSSLFSGQHVECNCFSYTRPFLGNFFVWGSMKNAHEIDDIKALLSVAFWQFTLDVLNTA